MDNQDVLEELQRARNLVVSLAKEIDVKNGKLLEMEFKLDEVSEALSKMKAEQTRLHQEYIEEKRKSKLASQNSEKLHQEFESLRNELEMTVERLDKQEAQHDQELKNLMLREDKLKAQSSMNSVYALIVQLDDLKKELDEKVDELQCLDNLNQALILKEHMSNLELQHARTELITHVTGISGLQDFWSSQTKIEIKRMGEVDPRPFKDACMKKFSGDWELNSTELCSLWQSLVTNPEWYPFKRELIDGKYQVFFLCLRDSYTFRDLIVAAACMDFMNSEFPSIIFKHMNTSPVINDALISNCEDIMLKESRSECGDVVCKAVSNALLEMNEYNGSGRYIVLELWNFKEGRKASLKEGVECILQE
ncbi:factor of DNA methylation 2-like [Durio zibethinus]|uniref:Factor of DNA methylation 2-like n=1 Tax=Durio zibethinus TaxID=66656 RepID=A0A6P6AHJ6_DURZI|nr:factor of DNA methylation 2-like [Durio zibethinus]